MGNYGSTIFQLTNPAEQFQRFQGDDLNDSIRTNQINIGREQAKQEAVKTQEINRQWEAWKAADEARKAAAKIVPNPGYYDPSQGPPPQVDQPSVLPADPTTGNPTLRKPEDIPAAPSANGVPAAVPANPGVSPAAIATPPSNTLGSSIYAGAVPSNLPTDYTPQNFQQPIVVQTPPAPLPPYAAPAERNSIGDLMGPTVQPGQPGYIAGPYVPPPSAVGATAPMQPNAINPAAPVVPSPLSPVGQPVAPRPVAGVAAPRVQPPAAVPPTSGGLKPVDLNDHSTYRVEHDDDKFHQIMEQKGFGLEALQYDQERAKALNQVYEMQKNAHEAQEKKNGLIAETAQSVMSSAPVDFSLDPNSPEFQQQSDTFRTVAKQGYRRLVSAGVISPTEEAQYEQVVSGPITPQLIAQIKQIAASATGAEAQQREERERIQSRQTILNGTSENKRRDIENQKDSEALADKKVSDATAALSLSNSASDYDQRAADMKLDPATLARLPRSKDLDWSPKNLAATQEQIRLHGMTTEQQAQYQLRKEAQTDRALVQQSLIESRGVNEAFKQFMMAGQPTPAQRQASKQVDDLTKAEQPLWRDAGRLQEALKDGSYYISKAGGKKSFDDGDKDKDGDIADMQARLDGFKAQLKSTINHKYDIVDQFGGSPSVTRKDALEAVESLGPAKKQNPPPPSPVKATPSPAPKATPAPATKAAAPIRKYNKAGDAVEWNGRAWVAVPKQ